MGFRLLKADEIDVRIAMVKANGVSLLLYKDARCDMNILDETVGPASWQRSHEVVNGNLFCNVSIKCGDEWITKQDVGTESYTEKEKGQASDSFKRACFNWGLGRELYTAPFIWVNAGDCTISNNKCYDRFYVKEIGYNNRKISYLVIANSKTKKEVYRYGSRDSKGQAEQELEQQADKIRKQLISQVKVKSIRSIIQRLGVAEKAICSRYKIDSLEDITEELYPRVMNALKLTEDKQKGAKNE